MKITQLLLRAAVQPPRSAPVTGPWHPPVGRSRRHAAGGRASPGLSRALPLHRVQAGLCRAVPGIFWGLAAGWGCADKLRDGGASIQAAVPMAHPSSRDAFLCSFLQGCAICSTFLLHPTPKSASPASCPWWWLCVLPAASLQGGSSGASQGSLSSPRGHPGSGTRCRHHRVRFSQGIFVSFCLMPA